MAIIAGEIRGGTGNPLAGAAYPPYLPLALPYSRRQAEAEGAGHTSSRDATERENALRSEYLEGLTQMGAAVGARRDMRQLLAAVTFRRTLDGGYEEVTGVAKRKGTIKLAWCGFLEQS